MDTIALLGNLLGTVGMVLLLVLSHREMEKLRTGETVRRRAVRRLARDLGLEHYDRPVVDYSERHRHRWFRPRDYSYCWAYNLVSGAVELAGHRCRITLGDYGRSDQRVGKTGPGHGSFLLVELPFVAVPDLSFRPSRAGDGLLGALGRQDLDVGTRGFSEGYVIRCAEPDFARALFTPRLAKFIEIAPPVEVDVRYDEMLVVSPRAETLWKPDEYGERLVWAGRFLERWPEHVTMRLARRQPASLALL